MFNQPQEVHLIANPLVKAKFERKFKKISPIHIQEWAIASLLTNAFCSAAVERFFGRLFAEMGFVSTSYGMSRKAIDIAEKIANEPQQ